MSHCTGFSHAARRGGLLVLFVMLAACADEALPTEAPIEMQSVVAEAAEARAVDEALASLEDVLDRVLPELDDSAVPPGLSNALENLAGALANDDRGSARTGIDRARAAVNAQPMAASPAVNVEMDAIRLALAAVERAL